MTNKNSVHENVGTDFNKFGTKTMNQALGPFLRPYSHFSETTNMIRNVGLRNPGV